MGGMGEKGSRYYAVITLGRGNRVERASRTGDDFARADISMENTTYRMEVTPLGEVTVLRIGKRWKAADASPPEDWEEICVSVVDVI